jgi:ribosomal protein S6--L-glutamate ligase
MMKLISFDAMRTCGISGITYVKPEHAYMHIQKILQADWLLFPPYWQVNALYYGLKKPLFPSISTYHLGHDKVEMTRVVQLLWPRRMPETFILNNSDTSRAWVLDHFGFPFVGKAVKDSMGDGVWLIEDLKGWWEYAASQKVLYVQEYLPIDRDLRLVVIGRRVVAAYWRRHAAGAFHNNVAKGGFVDTSHVPEGAVALVEEMALRLDVDHAGFDIAQVGERYYFFEFNRLFGTAGLKKMGISTGTLIYAYLRSTIIEDSGMCLKQKVGSLDPYNVPAALSW